MIPALLSDKVGKLLKGITVVDVAVGGEHDEGRLWGGRFKKPSDPALLKISRSPRKYFQLVDEDVRGSIAHLGELEGFGVLTGEERQTIEQSLLQIARDYGEGLIAPDDSDEDIHGFLERILIERTGEVGGKVRAGRSRNDQTSNDLRLRLRDESYRIATLTGELVSALIERAEEAEVIIAPGFTHLQPAQPIILGHQLLAHAQGLARDVRRLKTAQEAVSLSPLGAAALAGSRFHHDPLAAAQYLGYQGVVPNSIDAVGSRDHVIEFLYATAMVGNSLSRLADELILWGTAQFGWIEFDEAFATGSSIMPQKKNPDIPELTRGKSSRLTANLVGMLTVMKGVPFAYNRDFADDKHYVFDTVDVLTTVLPAMTGFVGSMQFRPERIYEQAQLGFTLATELADWLSEQGIPFSEAHDITGTAVLYCEERGIGLDELTESDLATLDSRITPDVLQRLSAESAVRLRNGIGGTAPERQQEQRERLTGELDQLLTSFETPRG